MERHVLSMYADDGIILTSETTIGELLDTN